MNKKGSKIALHGSVNSFHANLSNVDARRFDEEFGGLPVLNHFGLPINLSYQEIDKAIYPWLKKVTAFENVSILKSTYGHGFLEFMSTKAVRFENAHLKEHTIPVSFFSEFFVPAEQFIPTEYFLILKEQSRLYSLMDDSYSEGDISVQQFTTTNRYQAIKYGSKIGIVMDNQLFNPILNAFFLFQRYPNMDVDISEAQCRSLKDWAVLLGTTIDVVAGRQNSLDYFVKIIKAVSLSEEEYLIVMPLDLEAPYVGSYFGAKIWSILLKELQKQDLIKVFTNFTEDYLLKLKAAAIPSKRPHREIGKWNSHSVQTKHTCHTYNLSEKLGHSVEFPIFSIAATSDILAAWDRKLATKEIKFDAIDLIGTTNSRVIGYNQFVIDIQLSARRCLSGESNYATFADALKGIKNYKESFLVVKLLAEAEKRNW